LRSATEKNIFQDLSSSVLSQFKKYHPSGNSKCYYLGILKSLKLRILVRKMLLISLKLNFTPNTLGCKGLRCRPGAISARISAVSKADAPVNFFTFFWKRVFGRRVERPNTSRGVFSFTAFAFLLVTMVTGIMRRSA